MDEIVKQAIAKWPNVPHCYGWLNLDARGHWRMRDERAQQQNLPGDKLAHAALLAFIARNYAHDERGCWFFQNGPQRVYLNLEATPYIVRTDPVHGWLLHTGAQLGAPHAAYLTETGELILRSGDAAHRRATAGPAAPAARAGGRPLRFRAAAAAANAGIGRPARPLRSGI